jgi:SnoaL-like protein
MNSTEQLISIEEIKGLKARYFRYLDTKEWNLLSECLTPDAVCDYRGAATDPATGFNAVPSATGKALNGRLEVIAALSAGLCGVVSAHQGYLPEIEVDTDNSAHGIWAMCDYLRFPMGAPVAQLVGFGHYHESYERQQGVWRISSLRLTRLRVDVFSPKDPIDVK